MLLKYHLIKPVIKSINNNAEAKSFTQTHQGAKKLPSCSEYKKVYKIFFDNSLFKEQHSSNKENRDDFYNISKSLSIHTEKISEKNRKLVFVNPELSLLKKFVQDMDNLTKSISDLFGDKYSFQIMLKK